tara:strand:- start:2076 stop:2468 length:393 start_codon:yes stop_codon:yes gene_type:complete
MNNMTTPLAMVREFAARMDQPLDQKWGDDEDLEEARFAFIREEFQEIFDESCLGNDSEAMLKELADGIIVINGYAATFGWDLDEATRRVHESNMSKLNDDGKPLKNGQGKVLKGPNYKKCNLKDLVGTNK